MSSNNSIMLTNLDFDTLKNTFKMYLKAQTKFQDYDFEGSNINVLLDILSHNTFQNSFYLNMIGNEMFMDTAQLRDSVVSHAKDLNYVPRSFKSAQAVVNLTINSNDINKRSLVVPKGTTFTSKFGNKNFTFSTAENNVINDYVINSNKLTFTETGVNLFEGIYLADTYLYTSSSSQRFIISNKNVDTSSISVTVIEDNGATNLQYSRTTSLFDLDSSSKVFFVQGAENDSYEIIFGDGVSGRAPKNNSTIIIEYRISNGELPNGCSSFIPDSTIDGEADIVVTTVSPATSGAVSESIQSIKYNAPRHFTTQERAVTTEDYENLLKANFPEINLVTVFGGEDLDPPQYGKVFVAVDLNDLDKVPDNKKDEYYKFLKPRSPVSIDPVFVELEYTYLQIVSNVAYNINSTKLTSSDIKTIVMSAILDFAKANLNSFNKTFRYSKLLNSIDTSQSSIVSNETTVYVIKKLTPNTGVASTFDIDFKLPLNSYKTSTNLTSISSSDFIYRGQRAKLTDDNNGNIIIVSALSNLLIDTVGIVDYDNGLIQFSNFKVDSYFGDSIKIYGLPKNKDISTLNNVILNISEEDINLTITPVRD